MNKTNEPGKIWNKMFISIFFANLALNLGQFMSNSLLSVYSSSLGATASVVGMLMSTFAISSISFRFIASPIMDTYNKKHVVIFAMLVLATSFLGFSISKSVTSLMCFRLLQGAGMAFGNACCLAMAAETLPKDKYGTGIGYYSLAQVISQSIGPSIGLWLADVVGYNMTFAINAMILLFAAFLASRIKIDFKRTTKFKLSINSVIAKEALLPACILFCLSFGVSAINSFLILTATFRNVTGNIGLYFTVSAMTLLVTRPAVGKLTDKYGLVKICVPALLFNVIAFFIISKSDNLLMFLLASFISAFGYGACQPAIQTLSMKSTSREHRGAASSTNYIGNDLGNLVGPTVAGMIAQSFGYVTMWQVMTIPFVVASLAMLVFRVRIVTIERNFESRQNS